MTTEKIAYIDLHIHSNCSDGALSPTELVDMAKSEGLATIALADHDSVAGITEAMSSGVARDIEVIPAVELSVQFSKWQDVHLLGYGIDYTDKGFCERLTGFRERREQRNTEILRRVNEALVSERRTAIELSEVLAYSRDAIGRPHIARALLERGYVDSVEEAFRSYLIPCNIPKFYWPIDDAICEIQRRGGIAVLAHPTTISGDRHELHNVIRELSKIGLDGIEVFNNMALPNEMEYLRRLADELGLVITGGSDFHGIEEGQIIGRGRGGIRFSADLLAPLKERLSQRRDQLLSL